MLSGVAAVAWAAGIFALSAQSDPPGSSWITFPHADLVAHTILYGVLAGLLRGAGCSGRVAVAVAVGYGISDEVHQAWVPKRTPSLLDLSADLLGATLGATVLARAARAAGVAVFGRRRR